MATKSDAPSPVATPPRQPAAGKPPKALMKYLMNPLMRALLRSRFHGRVSGGLMLLTFTGHKSGKQFTTPVAYHPQADGTILIYTQSPWWKNLQGGAPVVVRVRGRDLPGHATVNTDPEEVLRQVQGFLREKGVRNMRQIGIMSLDVNRPPTLAELQAATQGMVLVRIRPERA